jgi:hypothetical protein
MLARSPLMHKSSYEAALANHKISERVRRAFYADGRVESISLKYRGLVPTHS